MKAAKKKTAKSGRAAKSAGPSKSLKSVKGPKSAKPAAMRPVAPGRTPKPAAAPVRPVLAAVPVRPAAPVAKAPPVPKAPPLNPKQIAVYRGQLVERKRGLSEMYNRNKTYGRLTEDEGTQDLADKASSAYTKEFLYSLSNTDREVLQKVDEALVRLDAGGFGQCLECGAEINRKRLEAVPWASHCIVCQEKREKGLL
jgi:DnaK suppressor protein